MIESLYPFTMPAEMRLDILRSYLNEKISGYPKYKIPYEEYVMQFKRINYPDSVYYARKKAKYCFYCERKFNRDTCRKSVDHFYSIIYRHLGEKFVICCTDCNNEKGCAHPIQYINSLEIDAMFNPNGLESTKISNVAYVLSENRNAFYLVKTK